MDKSSFLGSVFQVIAPRVARTLITGLVLVVASHAASAQSSDSRVNIDAFGEVFSTALAAPANQTRIFVFRNNQAPNALPVNIYLNGQYHASLLRGGFSEFCAAPGAVNIKAALDDASRLHTSKLDAGQRLALQAGQTIYLKVDESTSPENGLLSGTAAQAKADIEGTRRQIHTISRAKAALTCGQPAPVVVAAPPPPPKPPAPREYALETDALFEFGKAEIRERGRHRQWFTDARAFNQQIVEAPFRRQSGHLLQQIVARLAARVHPVAGVQPGDKGSTPRRASSAVGMSTITSSVATVSDNFPRFCSSATARRTLAFWM